MAAGEVIDKAEAGRATVEAHEGVSHDAVDENEIVIGRSGVGEVGSHVELVESGYASREGSDVVPEGGSVGGV